MQGWEVVGIDFVERAVGRARQRAISAAVNVTLKVGDVTRLPDLAPGDFDLVLDVGCLHSLPSNNRGAFVRGVTEACRPGGLFVLLTFVSSRLRPLLGAPQGIAKNDIEGLFNEFFEVTPSGFRVAAYSESPPTICAAGLRELFKRRLMQFS
jgi:SAM-dependent methyltransferase